MFYYITRYIFKKAFSVFYQKVTVIGKENVLANTPIILAINHPNSFMDAMIVAVNLDEPVNSLTRGDAFKNKIAAGILRASHMIPVYRLSEGIENVSKNLETFQVCQSIFNANGTVLIFVEGLCINNWKLRPLKKGVMRLAQQAWQYENTMHTVVIPVGLTYQHYKGAGKSMIINFGSPLSRNDFIEILDQPNFSSQFNRQLRSSLEELIFTDDELVDGSIRQQKFITNWNNLEKKYNGVELLSKIKQGFNEKEIKPTKKFIPSAIHASIILIPHYWICSFLTGKFTKGTVHYDSVLFGLLVFLLPFYVLILIGIYFLIRHFV
ncbi:MAG: 1-acyl-sn-glycerol-3-phosphate acyltransferase [Bacteroidia bacterium]